MDVLCVSYKFVSLFLSSLSLVPHLSLPLNQNLTRSSSSNLYNLMDRVTFGIVAHMGEVAPNFQHKWVFVFQFVNSYTKHEHWGKLSDYDAPGIVVHMREVNPNLQHSG